MRASRDAAHWALTSNGCIRSTRPTVQRGYSVWDYVGRGQRVFHDSENVTAKLFHANDNDAEHDAQIRADLLVATGLAGRKARTPVMSLE